MALDSYTRAMLLHETRSLVARLAMVKSFALQESMLPAAALLPAAQSSIDRLLWSGTPPAASPVAGIPALAAAGGKK